MNTKFVTNIILLFVILICLFFYSKIRELEMQKKQENIKIQNELALITRDNNILQHRNDELRERLPEPYSLDYYQVMEEKARESYGMIGKNEKFFVVPKESLRYLPDIPDFNELDFNYNTNSNATDNNFLPNTGAIKEENQIAVLPILALESMNNE